MKESRQPARKGRASRENLYDRGIRHHHGGGMAQLDGRAAKTKKPRRVAGVSR
jgi:hypothetical protein